MIITSKTSMIFSICSQISVVSSMLHQRVINESSLKEQWIINVSEVNEAKAIKIKKVSIGFIKVSNMSLQRFINESSTKQLWNIKVSEISSIKPMKVINACFEVFAVTSMLLQRIINEKAMILEWFRGYHNKTNKHQKCSHRNYQCFKYFSPKNHQRINDEAARKYQCFGD